MWSCPISTIRVEYLDIFGEPDMKGGGKGFMRMDLEGDDFVQFFVKVVREFERATTRREAAQKDIDCVAERVGRFNGDKVPF